MTAMIRKESKVFAGKSTDSGVFGSAQSGVPQLSTDVEALTEDDALWGAGWNGCIVSNEDLIPPLEEMQTASYATSYQVNYLLEQGIPAWDAKTTYFIGSYVKEEGVLFYSLIDDNIGNELNDSSSWIQFLLPTEPQAGASPYVNFTGTIEGFTGEADGLIVKMKRMGNHLEIVACGSKKSDRQFTDSFAIILPAGLSLSRNAYPVTQGNTITTYFDAQQSVKVYYEGGQYEGDDTVIAASFMHYSSKTRVVNDWTGTDPVTKIMLACGTNVNYNDATPSAIYPAQAFVTCGQKNGASFLTTMPDIRLQLPIQEWEEG